jgi:hypothetical protein
LQAPPPARPWYGLDDTHFVKGVETMFVNRRGIRMVAKAWAPPPVVDDTFTVSPAGVGVTVGAGAGSAGVQSPKEAAAPFPRGVLIFVHGYVRGAARHALLPLRGRGRGGR